MPLGLPRGGQLQPRTGLLLTKTIPPQGRHPGIIPAQQVQKAQGRLVFFGIP